LLTRSSCAESQGQARWPRLPELTKVYIRSRAAARVLNPRVQPDSLAHPLAIAGAVKLAAGPGAGAEARVLLFTEAMVLAVLGGTAGVAVAQWGGAAIRALLLPDTASFNLATDWRTMGVAFGCASVAALLTAVGPAVVAARTDLVATLKSGAREGTVQRSRMRAGLVVAQGALSVVLLVGAGLFVQSFVNARAVPLGIRRAARHRSRR